MKKIISFAALVLAAMSASANTYYCDPASENKKGGDSWEKALAPEIIRGSLSKMTDGDTIFIKGGTVTMTSTGSYWGVTKSMTFIGGFDPAATGKVTAMPTYPSATPTVFSGDINQDGKASKGDAVALFRVDYSGDDAKVCTIQGIDMAYTYNDAQGADADIDSYLEECSAIRLICGTTYIKNCHIYEHVTPNNKGSQCVTNVGAKLHMMDCEVHDGIALSRGGLLRARSYFIGGDKENYQLPSTVLERCCFYNGSALGLNADDPSMSLDARIAAKDPSLATGTYGGGLQISSGALYMINSSVLSNKNYSNGGGISGNVAGFFIISSTIGNNEGIRDDHDQASSPKNCCYGSSLRMESDGIIKIANTYVTDVKDNSKKQYSPIYQDGNNKMMSECIISGGYNVLGTICYYPDANVDTVNVWQPTDLHSIYNGGSAEYAQPFSKHFGTIDNFKDNGGCSKTLYPLTYQSGDNVAHLQELADAWFPNWTKVDASLDQRGMTRVPSATCVGAADPNATEPMALEGVTATPHFDINNTIYNVLGQPVAPNYNGMMIIKGQKYMLR
ncbi:MAG: hypothetical protein KBS40_01895 [Bacteroidales bacterium]|nr:hypothetical protein [Bacteroidales bacterium]